MRSSIQQDVTALTPSLFVGVLILPAVFFSLAYFPTLKQSLVLVSPYKKAHLRRRAFAAAIDGLFVTTCWVAYWNAGSLLFGGLAVLYLLGRDGVGGQSIGRFLVGQAVVYVNTGQRCGLRGSVARNFIFVLPGANLAAIVLETRTLMRDPQGQRLGDRLAHTQVVEGLGARDVVKYLQQWRAKVLSDLPRARRPDRVVIRATHVRRTAGGPVLPRGEWERRAQWPAATAHPSGSARAHGGVQERREAGF